jgi:dTDP-4-dehydrorhamnose reductase
MNPRILLTGRNGQVGYELFGLLPQLGEVIALGREQLDLLKPEDIRRVIREIRPNLVVNAAAYTAVDQAEKEEATARAINADAPAVIAEEAKRIGAALVHYSTDYVFNGSKTSPYEEDDPVDPINVYGKTKLAGEQAIQSSGVPYLIFRTAWIYATRGRNFVLTILRLATQREELQIVTDQIGAPSWSREIAAATTQILVGLYSRGSLPSSISELSGIYHMTAAGETSWYEFTKAILEKASRMPLTAHWFATATGGQPVVTRRIIPIKTSEYPTPARRPAYSVLSNSHLLETFGVQLPVWDAQLQRLFLRGDSLGLQSLRNHNVKFGGHRDLRQMGWAKASESAKVARRAGQCSRELPVPGPRCFGLS